MGGILADDMGLGKTLQILAFLLSKKEEGESRPALIVAPTSLVYNWASEIEKFTPELSYNVVHGSRPERESIIKGADTNAIFITSYATLRRDIDLYGDIVFSSIILDEAQHIKNETSKAAQSAKKLIASNRFALTGTPMENHLGEFWSIFDFVLPGHLGSRYSFSKLYEKPITKEQDLEKSEALRALIKPFLLRRLKRDVLPELPEKIESQIVIEMSEEQKRVYAATVSRIRGEINKQISEHGFAGSQLQILSALTRLRQICSHPGVYLDDYEGTSGKFEALRELLEELKESGHRTLIFSQFTSVLNLIRQMVEEMNLSYHYLDGKTKARDRGQMVDVFNGGEGDVFLISLKAGGSGLNLTGADTVIHFDPWWNPAVEDQASDRAYRIGQTKNVHVMKLVTRGTIEEKIVKLQERKRELIDKVVKPGETFITKLDEKEVREMFDM
jgi:SNF2 family DNA or RNA helicase